MASEVHRAMAAARRSAVHLEMRDVYTPDDPAFACWRTGVGDPVAQYRSWSELVAAIVRRGVHVRRARIVSKPVTEYIRFEHAVTAGVNVAAGEQGTVAAEKAGVRLVAARQRLLAVRQ